MKLRTAAAGAFAVGLVGAAVFSHQQIASAAPVAVICAPYTVNSDTWPPAVLRTTVKVCSLATDPNEITSVCKTETIVRPNGLEVLVSSTC